MTRHLLRRVIPVTAVAIALLTTACNPEGYFDDAQVTVTVDGSTIKVVGWAIDRDDVSRSIDVHVYVDSRSYATHANGYRPDVDRVYPGWGVNHGYSISVNASPGTHRVCVYGINLPGTPGDNALIDCKTVTIASPPTTTTRPPTTPTTPPTTTPPPVGDDVSSELIALLNAERATSGVGPLSACAALRTAADNYALVMAASQWFDSTGPDGSTPWSRTRSYGGTSAAESISFGFDSPADLIGSLAEDPNALLGEFSHVGVGRTWSDPDGAGPMQPGYWWVVDFGSGGTC